MKVERAVPCALVNLPAKPHLNLASPAERPSHLSDKIDIAFVSCVMKFRATEPINSRALFALWVFTSHQKRDFSIRVEMKN